jgi:diguanylate cyclase
LKRFAESIKSHIRKEDFFARFGGEEFVIILRHTPHKEACKVAYGIKRLVERLDLSDINPELHITVSIGIASCDEVTELDMHHLFKLADTRLYQAKRRGRNRIASEVCDKLDDLQSA